MDHSMLMKAVRKHTDHEWLLLYIERWLKSPIQLEDGLWQGGTRILRDELLTLSP